MNRRSPSLPKSIHKPRTILRRPLTRLSATAVSLAMLLAGQDARAVARTWVGSASTDWAVLNGFNAIPVSGDSLVFGADGAAGLATSPVANTLTNSLAAGFSIVGITHHL